MDDAYTDNDDTDDDTDDDHDDDTDDDNDHKDDSYAAAPGPHGSTSGTFYPEEGYNSKSQEVLS